MLANRIHFVLVVFPVPEKKWKKEIERERNGITSFAAFSLFLRTAGRIRILVFALPTYQHICGVHVSTLYVWSERRQSSPAQVSSLYTVNHTLTAHTLVLNEHRVVVTARHVSRHTETHTYTRVGNFSLLISLCTVEHYATMFSIPSEFLFLFPTIYCPCMLHVVRKVLSFCEHQDTVAPSAIFHFTGEKRQELRDVLRNEWITTETISVREKEKHKFV